MEKISWLVSLLVLGLLLTNCTGGSQIQSVPTDVTLEPSRTATMTLTPLPSSTSTPRSTKTPRPTATATPIPDWVVNFTEPILKAISDRPPTYEDDFSNQYSGWYNGQTTGHPDVLILGEKRYDNGEYYVVAYGATESDPVVCSGGEDPNVGRYTDFVAEFDVRFVSAFGANHQDWQLQYHRNGIGHYFISLAGDGWIHIAKCAAGSDGCSALVSYTGNPINSDDSWNHVVLIVRGTEMAAYVNSAPTLYINDVSAPEEFKKGYFSVTSCNFATNTLETRWDNFKIWDISNLP